MNEEEFMSDIKDETSVDIDTAEKSVDMIKDYYNREHKRNKDRIKYGSNSHYIPYSFICCKQL